MKRESSLSILARCSIVTTKVRRVVATKAGLRLQILGLAVGGITHEHTEALYAGLNNRAAYISTLLTGLKAVTWPLPPET